ncbi:MAG: DNA cytosine methyltransferase [Paenibacillaceae bacterium]
MKTEYTIACLFGGIGGGSLGFQGARAEYMGKVAKFRTICSIDSDPVVCRNYEAITGGKAVCIDLFDRQQYKDFHSVESPPDNWHEAEPWDIWKAFGEQVPDVIFTSPPCKGFSGLLPEKSAASKKYQALNLLTIRGIDISLAACRDYGGELPALFLLENVPRIMTRGKSILKRIKDTLKKYGYVVNDESHDCGEIGGLGQHRKRYLLIARNEKRMPAFVYKPEIKPLKTIGDVIGPLPLPGDEVNGGPMHRVPTLQRKTWERLAFIPAGGDWRDLEKVEFEKYRLNYEPRVGAWAVEDWDTTSGAVTGGAGVGISNGVSAVADPRTGFNKGTHASIYRVSKSDEPAPTVTGAARPNNGALSVGDPRLKDRDSRHAGVYRVVRVDEPSPCVTGTRFGSGALAIADPRTPNDHYEGEYNRVGGYGVQEWEETAKTVRGAGRIMNSPSSVADPRVNDRDGKRQSNGFPVRSWDGQSFTVTGEDTIGSGAQSVADPRVSDLKGRFPNKWQVQDWNETAATVTGSTDIQSGAPSINDPRLGCAPRSGSYGVQDWNQTANTVTGSGDVHSGSTAVADPRIPEQTERCVMIIIAEDGTWHRPFTTYELAVGLQGFPAYLPDGRPFQLEGCSDAKAREYTGNAVPPDAAEAIANVIIMAMVMSEAGETFIFTHQDVWVKTENTQEIHLIH